MMYLRMAIRYCSRDDAECEHSYTQHLHPIVFLAPCPPNHQCRDTAPTSQNNVYRYRYIKVEGIVVQKIDSKEQNYIRQPLKNGYAGPLEVVRRIRGRELPWPGQEGNGEELDEGDEET